jgi:hypothetical protein
MGDCFLESNAPDKRENLDHAPVDVKTLHIMMPFLISHITHCNPPHCNLLLKRSGNLIFTLAVPRQAAHYAALSFQSACLLLLSRDRFSVSTSGEGHRPDPRGFR